MVSPEIWSSEPSPERLAPHGLLVLLTGPTGVGKDTVLNNLSIPYVRLVTCTARPQGKNEIEGFDYYFISKSKFEEMIKNDEFFEHTPPDKGYYGITKKEMTKRNEKLAIWRLTPDGVFGLLNEPEKKKALEPCLIICLTADLGILSERVLQRGREKGFDVPERAKRAYDELNSISGFIKSRRNQDYDETSVIARRLGEVGYEDIMFHNGHGWTDEFSPKYQDRIAVRLIENREGLRTFNGLPRTLGLVEETIRKVNETWNLPQPTSNRLDNSYKRILQKGKKYRLDT